MKQIIILLLLIIAGIYGFGKYNEYLRFNSEATSYKTPKNIDVNYYNKETVINYFKAIESLNSYINLQWSANKIDVRKPENDKEESKVALAMYSNKLANVKYFESILQNSFLLKKAGNSNEDILSIEKSGKDLKTIQGSEIKQAFHNLIVSMFMNNEKVTFGNKSAFIFEVQKLLAKNGAKINIDGLYRLETLKAIKAFEEKNNLFADGKLDLLTLETLLK